MIITTTYGYVQPYKHRKVNILETALSINTLILLLLRNTRILEETLGSLGELTVKNESAPCQDSVVGVTQFAWLLMPAYYLPLIILCVVCTTWTIFKARWVRCLRLNSHCTLLGNPIALSQNMREASIVMHKV